MLKRVLIVAGMAAAPLLVPVAAQAQNAPQNGVLVIYGNDKCPTNDNGEEIVICQRLDEVERFRIPRNLREQAGPPQSTESWAVRSQDALDPGHTGPNSCSTVGAIGSTGCFVRNATRSRGEARQRQEATNALPLP